MIVKVLTENHFEFLSLTVGCRGLSKSTLFKMSNCWKSHAVALNSKIHRLFKALECSSCTFQGNFKFQGLFKKALYNKVLFKSVGTLEI